MELLSKIENISSVKRDDILNFEEMIKRTENSFVGDSETCPLQHSFCDGIYVREIFIPAGVVLTGKIHKHAHPNFLMKGEVDVMTEFGGTEHLIAPVSMISKAGTKRVVRTFTDTVWITIHNNPTNTQDLSKLEKIVIADNYGDYEKFINNKSVFNRLGIFLRKHLKINKL